MAIIDSLIVLSCVGMSGQQNDACQKALQAGSKQSGVEQSMNTYEQNRLRYLQSGAENFMGKDAVAIVGGTGWAVKSAVDRKASFGLPSLGLCDTLKFEWNSNTERLVFQWKF